MIVTVVGARPQFIKAAVVSHALQRAGIPEVILHTGQHYDDEMSDVFWRELGMPAWERNFHVGSGPHGWQTAIMIEKIEAYLLENRDKITAIQLYGDTNSTVAGALAASKLQIPIIHIEAGLRSFNRAMPEEINRIVTDHLSTILFCSSDVGKEHLATEGIIRNVFITGDVMYDAVSTFSKVAREKADIHQLFPGLKNGYYLLTVHRPSNTDVPDNLNQILDSIGDMDQQVLWPVHPRNKAQLSSLKLPSNLVLQRPLSYFEMLSALDCCQKVLTDSGGLQKEAYWNKKPCITLRDETEWVETTHNNWNIVAGNKKEKIIASVNTQIDPSTWVPLYGDGNAGDAIVSGIRQVLYNS